MKKVFASILLVVLATPGFAEVPIDRLYQSRNPDKFSIHSILEQQNLNRANNLLFNPVCSGQVQTPALITDLHAFFAGYSGTRVADRGNGHYLLMQKPEFLDEANLQMPAVSNRIYAELDVNSAAGDKFLSWSDANFFADNELGTTTCQAAIIDEINHFNPGRYEATLAAGNLPRFVFPGWAISTEPMLESCA